MCNYPELCSASDWLSSSDIILHEKQWWHPEMVAVFPGQWFLSIKNYYYMNANEIPGELSRENMLSHVKIVCYLRT